MSDSELPQTPNTETGAFISDGEKQVIANVLQLMFANGKGAAIIRAAVQAICGAGVAVSHDTLVQVVSAAVAMATVAWSWWQKSKAAAALEAARIAAQARPLPTVAEIKGVCATATVAAGPQTEKASSPDCPEAGQGAVAQTPKGEYAEAPKCQP